MYGDVNKVSKYIENGFDPNLKLIHGQTALHFAYIYSQRQLAEFLLSLDNIDASIVDMFGKKATDYVTDKDFSLLINDG
jgi:ankyrin repeat protein